MSTPNNNRRKITKTNNQNVIHKKVATGDANVEESIGKVSESMSVKTKKLNAEITKKEEEINPKLNLLKETARLEVELKKRKQFYEKKKKEEIDTINNLNKELDEQAEIIQTSSKDNVKLMKNLKDLEDILNKKYSKIMDSKIYKKRNKEVKNEQTINKDIEIHKKEIKIMEKEIKYEKKFQKRFQKKLEEKDAKLEELNKLNEEIEQLQKDLEELSISIKDHINCEKIIEKKKVKLNITMNEYEMEIKKEEMEKNLNKQSKEKKIKDGTTSKKKEEKQDNYLKIVKDKLLLDKYNYSKEVREKKMPNIPQVKGTTKPILEYINTEFNKINKRNKSFKELIGDNKSKEPKSVIDNVYQTQQNLFTEREDEILRKVIPEKYMIAYNDLYDSRKKENEEIEAKFEEHANIKKENVKTKGSIDFAKLKVISQERKNNNLNIQIGKNNKKLNDIKAEISDFKKKIDQQKAILTRMDKQKKNYLHIIDMIKESKRKEQS